MTKTIEFAPTRLRALNKLSNEFLAEVLYDNPFAERPFVPVPLSRWRGARDLGHFFRSRAPVVVLGVDYARRDAAIASLPRSLPQATRP